VEVDPPGPLAFGDQNINGGASAAIAVTVTNIGVADLAFTGAEIALTGADAGEFVLSADSGENPLTPNATRTVQVAFDPSSVGLKSATLTITSNDADDAIVEVALSGTGVDRQIDVTGGPLAFGNQDLDDGPTAGLQVTITNTGVSDLSFTGSQVALTGIHPSQFSISADSGENPLTSGATRTVTVVFNPSSVGLKSATLTITSDDGIAPTVEVALSGTGIDQEIDVTGGPLAFGNQDVDGGPTAGMQVTITNTGTVDLSFTGSEVALTGLHPGEFAITADSGENPLISGATRTITVVFNPNSVGFKSANLTITSDDTDEATLNVSLSGTGIDQEIDVIIDPLGLDSPNEEVDGEFGWHLSGVPDVNGDGCGDVVVGARSEDPAGSPTNTGRVYVYDGVTGALVHTLASPNEEPGGQFGNRVSGVSDVNGDGRGDVVVAAYFEDPGASPSDAGRAYIFDGSTGALLHTLVSPNEESGGLFGNAVSGHSDFNGDGCGDVVVGARSEDPGTSPSNAGRAYIYDGSTGALLRTLISTNEESGGQFGVSVSEVPDADGDGLAEPLVGAWHEDPGASPDGAGRVYFFSSIPSPEVGVDPPGPLAFGDQNIDGGPTAAITVTVTNFGAADLTFTGAEVALTGADASEFVLTADSGENPLTPNATRTVQLVFDPSTVGLKSATLTVTSNDADNAIVEVALSGTGVDREIDVTGGPLAFGNQDL
ncbi:MAG: choice-of-anchor D domain-containing protein, partial [Candidatus Omnitrophica bacterium]|nr:choice-of-anchor D domain-containing protein [Candidatus Omnitrophota bacterium]